MSLRMPHCLVAALLLAGASAFRSQAHQRCGQAHQSCHRGRCHKVWLAAEGSPQPTPALVPPPTEEEELAGPRVVTSPFTLRICGGALMLVVAFASAFRVLEGWSIIDSLYFTTTTLATIGFGDLRPTRPISRVLTALVGICGVGLLGGLVSAVVGEWFGDGREGGVGSATSRWSRWSRRFPSWAQALLLLSTGVAGVRLLEPPAGRPSVWDSIYLVAGAMTTAGLGDVVPPAPPPPPLK